MLRHVPQATINGRETKVTLHPKEIIKAKVKKN